MSYRKTGKLVRSIFQDEYDLNPYIGNLRVFNSQLSIKSEVCCFYNYTEMYYKVIIDKHVLKKRIPKWKRRL